MEQNNMSKDDLKEQIKKQKDIKKPMGLNIFVVIQLNSSWMVLMNLGMF